MVSVLSTLPLQGSEVGHSLYSYQRSYLLSSRHLIIIFSANCLDFDYWLRGAFGNGGSSTRIHGPSPNKSTADFGNTQVTCHVGMPSCGQRHRNMFIDLLLTCTITNTIINDSLASPPCASSPAPFFFCPPSHSCIICHLASQTQPGRGGSVERVHPPSPSSFAPWSSRHQVDYSHAPRRLPG